IHSFCIIRSGQGPPFTRTPFKVKILALPTRSYFFPLDLGFLALLFDLGSSCALSSQLGNTFLVHFSSKLIFLARFFHCPPISRTLFSDLRFLVHPTRKHPIS